MDVDAATRTMITNPPERTGRDLQEWFAVLDAAALAKHGQAMALLKSERRGKGSSASGRRDDVDRILVPACNVPGGRAAPTASGRSRSPRYPSLQARRACCHGA